MRTLLCLAFLLIAAAAPAGITLAFAAEGNVPAGRAEAAGPEKGEVKKVLLIGDSFMQGFAPPFRELLAQRGIETVGTGKQSTGLVHVNRYWLKRLPSLLEKHAPQLVICCLGANDTQGMRVGRHVLAFGGDGWRKEYGDRVKRLVEVCRARGARFVWLGLPQMKNKAYDRDIRLIEEVCKKAMEEEGGIYLSVYDVLTEGIPSRSGGGRQAGGKLRAPDGIHCSGKGYLLVVRDALRQLVRLQVLHERPQQAALEPGQDGKRKRR